MPKPYTLPTLYNEARQISISNLKEWDYLTPKLMKSGTITWSNNGTTTARISISANMNSAQPYIELEYNYNDEPRNYKIGLVSVQSNLGKGVIWYFLCPVTNKRCRKLYSIGGYFLHREAFNGCMYESQTQSKRWRYLGKTLFAYMKVDDLYDEIDKKHFKKFYAGKPTKRYLQIMKQIKRVESIPAHELRRLIYSNLR